MANTGINTYKNDILFCPLPTKKIYSAASLADAALVGSASDRSLQTHSSYGSYWADITETGKVTHVYVMSSGVETLRMYDGLDLVASVDAASWSVQTQQGAASTWTDDDGIQHFLIALSLKQNTDFRTTNLIKIDFTGSGKKIYEIAPVFSEKKYRIKSESDEQKEGQLVRLELQPTFRGYTSRSDIRGSLTFIPPLNGGAVRYTTELGILYDDPSWQTLVQFFQKNATGFFMSNEYGRYPQRCYTLAGLYPNFAIAYERLVADLKRYEQIFLTIAEA